ncbi:MAG: class I SAM-dependent methyltransferase [Micromonosporaceae bacterium]
MQTPAGDAERPEPAGDAMPGGDASGPEPAMRRTLRLLDPAPETPDLTHGYLDLIGQTPPKPTGIGDWLMRTAFVPVIYQRWWRPALGRLVTGITGPGMAGEYRLAKSWLGLSPGQTLVDLACGPGNFTRELAASVGETGLVIGLDMSTTMLAQALRDTPHDATNIAYVRADAMDLPFRAGCADAVCCFAALHLVRQPFRVLDKITNVLRDGGRLALMTSCQRGDGVPLTMAAQVAGRLSGLRVFGRDEITEALASRGFTGIRQRVAGAVQFVGGELHRRGA